MGGSKSESGGGDEESGNDFVGTAERVGEAALKTKR